MRKLKPEEMNRASVDAFRNQKKNPLVLILDNVRSALNVGSAFRTADAFALEAMYLCGITAQPPHREILKTAIGATESVKWHYEKSILNTITDLKSKGYVIYAVEQTTASVALQDCTIEKDQKIALIFGNEVSGVSDAILKEIDGAIEIPQFGTKHSLNIAVCLGIVVWEFLNKMKII